MALIEGDQVGERLRVRGVRHRVRTVDVGVEIRRDVGLELAQKGRELVDGRRQIDVGRVDDGRTLRLERGDDVVEDRLDDRAHQFRVVRAGPPDADSLALKSVIVEELRVIGERVAGLSGGRGVGSSEAFDIIEELAGLLGGAVGCSRVVTSARQSASASMWRLIAFWIGSASNCSTTSASSTSGIDSARPMPPRHRATRASRNVPGNANSAYQPTSFQMWLRARCPSS